MARHLFLILLLLPQLHVVSQTPFAYIYPFDMEAIESPKQLQEKLKAKPQTNPIDSLMAPPLMLPEKLPEGTYLAELLNGTKLYYRIITKSRIEKVSPLPAANDGIYLLIEGPDPILAISIAGKALPQIDENLYLLSKKLQKGKYITIKTTRESIKYSLINNKRKSKTWHYISPAGKLQSNKSYRKFFPHKPYRTDGYVAFNKPVYRHGDTLKMKAFALDRKFRPIKDSLHLRFNGRDFRIAPLRPGLFIFESPISDSLLLDRNYSIQLSGPRKFSLRRTFRVEDYELKTYTFQMQMVKRDTFFKDESIGIRIIARDQNNNPAFGTQVNLRVHHDKLIQHPDKIMSFPKLVREMDTLLSAAESELTIPNNLFPSEIARYYVEAQFTSPNGELVLRKASFSYNPLHEHIAPKKPMTPISLQAHRRQDSVYISITNPDSLLYTLKVFEKNRIFEEKKGQSDMNHALAADPGQLYNIFLYSESGPSLQQALPPEENILNIEVEQPEQILPGSSITTTITVTDHLGRPVPNVDLTALAVNAKFTKSPVPSLPYLGKVYKEKKTNYRPVSSQAEAWKNLPPARKDIARFKLLNSLDYQIKWAKDLFTHYQPIQDSLQACISPFLTDGNEGQLKPVFLVYIENRLVYDAEAVGKVPYIFYHPPGTYQVKWRTRDRLYVLDSVEIKAGQHLFLSLDAQNLPQGAYSFEKKEKLSKEERDLRDRYSLKVNPQSLGYNDWFIGQYEQYHIPGLPYSQRRQQYVRVGPFNSSRIAYVSPGNFGLYLAKQSGIIEPTPQGLKIHSEPQKASRKIPRNFNQDLPKISDELEIPDLEELKLPQSSGRKSLEFVPEDESAFADLILPQGYSFAFVSRSTDSSNWYSEAINNYSRTLSLPAGTYDLVFLTDKDQIVKYGDFNTKASYIYYLPKKKAETDRDGRWKRMSRQNMMVCKEDGQTLFFNQTMALGPHQLRIELGIALAYIDEVLLLRNNQLVQGKLANRFIVEFENLPAGNYQVVLLGNTDFGVKAIKLKADTSISVDTHKAVWEVNGKTRPNFYTNSYRIAPYLKANIPSIRFYLTEYITDQFFRNQLRSRNRIYLKIKDKNSLEEQNSTFGSRIERAEGRITDKYGTPLEGVSILVKGTSRGTYTDQEGYYSVEISPQDQSLVCTFLGYGTEEFKISNEFMENELMPTSLSMDEVVVKGSRSLKIRGLSGRVSGIGVYKKKDAELLYLPTNSMDNREVAFDDFNPFRSKTASNTFSEAPPYAQIRASFNDAAYWQPDLLTDENGQATFTARMPDDITAWDTYVLAINGNRQSGQTQGRIQAFAPLSAQLEVPRFLIEGDSSEVIAQVMNYEGDSIHVELQFGANGVPQSRRLDKYLLERRPILAAGDSLDIQYGVSLENGYQDGEKRSIQVLPRGLIEKRGDFYRMEGSQSIDIPGGAKRSLALFANPIHSLLQDIDQLKVYPHACNEQLISQLIALDAERALKEKMGLKFKGNSQMHRIERILSRRTGNYRLMSWWETGPSSPWISAYAYQALKRIKPNHPILPGQERQLGRYVQNGASATDIDNWLMATIALLEHSQQLNKAQIEEFLKQIKTDSLISTPFQRLRVLRIRQLAKFPVTQAEVLALSQTTLLGNRYWGHTDWHWHGGAVEASCLAYQMLKELKADARTLASIRDYLLLERPAPYGHNTREAAQLIQTFLPEWDVDSWSDSLSISIKTEKGSRSVKNFSQIIRLEGAATISKKGSDPLYLSVFEEKWNPNPSRVDSIFDIKSLLKKDGEEIQELQTGQVYSLEVEVETKRAASYVAITIPIPAGCTYASKSKQASESHREHFRDRAVVYLENLPTGKKTVELKLLAKFGGNYTLNPVRVELMYVPQLAGNNEMKKIVLK